MKLRFEWLSTMLPSQQVQCCPEQCRVRLQLILMDHLVERVGDGRSSLMQALYLFSSGKFTDFSGRSYHAHGADRLHRHARDTQIGFALQ